MREIRAEFLRHVDFIQVMRLLEEMGLWVRRSKTSSSRFYAATPPSFPRPFSQPSNFSPPPLSGASFRTSPLSHHLHYVPASAYQHGTYISSPLAFSSSPFEHPAHHGSISPLISNRESLHPLAGQHVSHDPSLLNMSGAEAILGAQQQRSHYDSVRAANPSPLHSDLPHESRPERLPSPYGLTSDHFPGNHRPSAKPLTISEAPVPRSPISRLSSLASMRAMLPPPRRLPFQHSPKKRHGLDTNPEHEIRRSELTSSAVTTEDLEPRPILSPRLQSPTPTSFVGRRSPTPQNAVVHGQDAMRTQILAFNGGEATLKSAAFSPTTELGAANPRSSRKRTNASRKSMPNNKPKTVKQPLLEKGSNIPHKVGNRLGGQSGKGLVGVPAKLNDSVKTPHASGELIADLNESSCVVSNETPRSNDARTQGSVTPRKKRQKRRGSLEETAVLQPGRTSILTSRNLVTRAEVTSDAPRKIQLEPETLEHMPVKDSWKDPSRLRLRNKCAGSARVPQRPSLADAAISITMDTTAEGSELVTRSKLDTPDGIGLNRSGNASRLLGSEQETNSRDVDVSCNTHNDEHDCGAQAILDKTHTIGLSDTRLPGSHPDVQIVVDVEADEPTTACPRKHDVATQTISVTKDVMISCCIGEPGTDVLTQTSTPTSNTDSQAIEDTSTHGTDPAAYDDDALIIGLQVIDEARALVHERLDSDLDRLEFGCKVDMRESAEAILLSVERLAQDTLDNHGTGVLNLPFGRMVGHYLRTREAQLPELTY